jgi:hypothetical protein
MVLIYIYLFCLLRNKINTIRDDSTTVIETIIIIIGKPLLDLRFPLKNKFCIYKQIVFFSKLPPDNNFFRMSREYTSRSLQ